MSFIVSRGRVARWPTRAALTLLLGLAAAPAAQAQTRQETLAPGGLIVGVAPAAPNSVGVRGVGLAPGVRLVPGDALTARRLRDSPGVRYVEPNRVFRATAAPAGSAQIIARQWGLGAINVAPAWAVPATSSVTVAILDSGIDVTHPDLAPNVWRNPTPTVGDINGFNTLTRTGNVRDDFGHGTAVAGVVGASPATATLGASGVAPHARLMAVKVLNASGIGTTASVVAGMRYALSHGARVMNLSLAGPDRSEALEEQIRAADDAGVIVVTSAGNQGTDIGATPEYPASYPEPNVIGVASTGPTGALSGFSNRGGPLSLGAPGEDILTTAPGSGYEHFYGTSAAAPQVTGAVALLEAARPDTSVTQVRAALENGARRLPGLAGMVRAGQLDVGAAMALLARAARIPRATVSLRARVIRRGHRRPLLRWSITGVGAHRVRVTLTRGSRAHVRVFGLNRRRVTVRRSPGRYRWRVVALGADNRPVASRTGHVRVTR